MSRLTIAIAAQITSQRHRELVSYTSNWYHIVVLTIPPTLLCERPFGLHPIRWHTPSIMRQAENPTFKGVWLCDECWDRFYTETTRGNELKARRML